MIPCTCSSSSKKIRSYDIWPYLRKRRVCVCVCANKDSLHTRRVYPHGKKNLSQSSVKAAVISVGLLLTDKTRTVLCKGRAHDFLTRDAVQLAACILLIEFTPADFRKIQNIGVIPRAPVFIVRIIIIIIIFYLNRETVNIIAHWSVRRTWQFRISLYFYLVTIVLSTNTAVYAMIHIVIIDVFFFFYASMTPILYDMIIYGFSSSR